jgi:hypothetical protein
MFAGRIDVGDGGKPKSLASYVTGLPSAADLIGTVTYHVQNVDSSETIYLGDSSVSTSNYGRKLDPGESVSVALVRDFLYATCAGSGSGVGQIALIVAQS